MGIFYNGDIGQWGIFDNGDIGQWGYLTMGIFYNRSDKSSDSYSDTANSVGSKNIPHCKIFPIVKICYCKNFAIEYFTMEIFYNGEYFTMGVTNPVTVTVTQPTH